MKEEDFEEMIEGLEEGLEIIKGNKEPSSTAIHEPKHEEEKEDKV